MSYLSKKFNMEQLRKIDIQKIGVYYTTDFDNVKAEFREEFEDYIDENNIISISADNLDKLKEDSYIEFLDTDEREIEDFIEDILKTYNQYLVVAFNSRWTGATGYKFITDKTSAFYRNYECSQYVVNGSAKGKTLLIKEYHHDVPMGHNTIIIGLTDNEYEKISEFCIEDIIKYAETMKKVLI